MISGYRPNNFFDEMTGVKRLGLLHIFSISGMHVAYFLSIIDQLMAWLGISRFRKAVIAILFWVDILSFPADPQPFTGSHHGNYWDY